MCGAGDSWRGAAANMPSCYRLPSGSATQKPARRRRECRGSSVAAAAANVTFAWACDCASLQARTLCIYAHRASGGTGPEVCGQPSRASQGNG